jgi:hypothetical protein
MRPYIPHYCGPHEVKLNRAMQLAQCGAYPTMFERLARHIGPELRDRLSARDIAAVVDAMRAAAQEAKGIAARGDEASRLRLYVEALLADEAAGERKARVRSA